MFSWSRLIPTLLALIITSLSIFQACARGLPFPSPEKTPLQQLTYESSQDFYADWSPDGQKIAIISDRSGAWNVWVINADGSSPQVLTQDHQATSPSWSPDGESIVYATDRASGMRFWTDLWIMKKDGSSQEPLLKTPTFKELVPSWSPNGQLIVTLSLDMNAPPAWRVLLIDLESRQTEEITQEGIPFSRLAWRPSGQEIAFVSDRSGHPEVWMMDQNGENAHPVTNDGAEKAHPDWSPDGKWIAFASKKAGNWDLWIIQPDGSGLRRLTSSPATDTLPDWSPDGKKIAFTSDRSGNQDIWVIDIRIEY
jgi:Tol biopolymer transport system component